MPRVVDLQSGPDDLSDGVGSDGQPSVSRSAAEDSDSDYDGDRDTRRRQDKQPASSSSQQENHIRQSASNAREAASSAASNSSSAENTGDSNDLRLITLVKRYERKLSEIGKRERDLAEREKASSSTSSKRRKSSSSRKHSSDTSDISDSNVSSDSSDASDSSDGGNRGRSSSSKGSNGKDTTLRQHAIMNKFGKLKYVDINVFSRANLNARNAKQLLAIKCAAEYSAAWASFNVELQQYLINAHRGADALMVSKYYSQIVRLLTDYSSQWQLVMELDEYIRGAAFTVNEQVVWNVDHDDDHVSRFKYDISFNHRDVSRVSNSTYTPSSQRGAHSNARRSGGNASNSNISSKPRNVCYAYNGLNSSTGEWTNSSHCLGADRCKFSHRCMHCKVEGHAIYERAECAAHPRVRAAPRQPSRRT
jgi:hypothetical protein